MDEQIHGGESTPMAPTGGYVRANGLRVYYEVHGEGEPLLLSSYSPDLNPIEKAFPRVKGLLRRASQESIVEKAERSRADQERLICRRRRPR